MEQHEIVMKIRDIAMRAASDCDMYLAVYDLYDEDSVGCCEAAIYAMYGFAHSYEWQQVERIASTMRLIKANENAMP